MAGKGTSTTHKRKNSPAKEDIEDTKRAKTDNVEEQVEGKNPGNVIGGFKATLKNPNVSDEAKEHAEEMIEKIQDQMDVEPRDSRDSSDRRRSYRYNEQYNKEGKDITHVIAGYKGVLARDNVSDEARQHAEQMLEELEGHQQAGGHLGHVISGYKSSYSSKDSSEDTKKRSRKVLDELGADDDYEYQSKRGDERLNLEGKDLGHVIGGYKATLSNANSSEEAKEHAKKVLEQLEGHQSAGRHLGHAMHGYRSKLSDQSSSRDDKEHSRRVLKELGDDDYNYSYRRDDRLNKEGKDITHVIAGYKGTLSNENVSEEAKENARKMLQDLEGHHSKGNHLGHVIGGYKAALSNPNTSEEARENARRMLEELGAEEYEYSHKYSRSHHGGNFNNVMGGYKATLHNENSSEEAKEHARQVLSENGIDEDSKLQSGKDESEKNPGNVIGGLKAALKNPNVSDAAKDDVRNKLDAQLEKTAH